jgi:hypothetical protein
MQNAAIQPITMSKPLEIAADRLLPYRSGRRVPASAAHLPLRAQIVVLKPRTDCQGIGPFPQAFRVPEN